MRKNRGGKFPDVFNDVDGVWVLDEEADMADGWSEVCEEVREALLRSRNLSTINSHIATDVPDHTDSPHHCDTAS